MKRKVGRPTKYTPALAGHLIRYFDIEPHIEKDITVTYKDGTQVDKTITEAVDLPFFMNWCRAVGIHQDTMLEWVKKYPEFSEAYKIAKELQKQIIIINGLRGLYSQPFAIFTMKNISDWRDEQHLKPGLPSQPINVFVQNIIAKAGLNDQTEREVDAGHTKIKNRVSGL